MFDPNYSYTDKTVANLVKIENSKTILQKTELSYNVRFKLTLRSKTLDLFHLAHILETDISLKDAEKLANLQKVDDIEQTRESIIKNFRNAMDFNRSNIADTYSELDKAVILHLNKLVLTQWRETWESNFRSFTDKMDDRWDNFVELRDANLNVNQIQMAVDELIEWYKFSIPTHAPVVRIAIAFYRLIEICPFTAGNKFTLTSILDYLLLKNGLGAKVYSSVVRVIHQNDQILRTAFKSSKQNFDLTNWIEAFTTALAAEMMSVREEINDFVLDEEKSKQQPFLNLNNRQLKVLKYLQNVPLIKREDYCHMMEVSTMTAFRDLNDLVRKKLLKTEGQGRGTKYKLASM